MRKKYPSVLLIFLSPFIAEFVSGSTPFFTFFRPFVFLIYVGFYGMGTLIIREIVAYKRLNYASVLLLGAAFGVLEEGIILKSWFDPTWMGAAITSKVLRVYGINILQPFANIVYHAVVSIAAPILLVESVTSRTPWLSRRKMMACITIFIISAMLMFLTFNYDYKIERWHYVLGFALLGLFTLLGFKGIKIPSGKKMYTPLRLWFLASLFVVLLFIIFYTLSSAGASWIVILGLALLLYAGYGRTFSHINWRSENQYFAVAAGIITGLLPVVAVMARTDPAKVLNFVGELIFIIILGRKCKSNCS